MARPQDRGIAIAGAGIAGLTAALAFAARGIPVTLFERAPVLEEAGAGLQLSPNATRILDRLGVIGALGPRAVRPEAITLRYAARLTAITRLPLGREAEARWHAPYLVAHRSDLQAALLECVAAQPRISLTTGAGIEGAAFEADGVRPSSAGNAGISGTYRLLVGADGVWSGLRALVRGTAPARYSGYMAWRAVLEANDMGAAGLDTAVGTGDVTAFLSPHFHLVVYPMRGGRSVNLVAVTKGDAPAERWSNRLDVAPLAGAMRSAHPALARLADAASWTAWPIFTADPEGGWTRAGRLALVGDAAHAMTPFAAQGAAMAIEDAAVLSMLVARERDIATALQAYETLRRPRIRRVAGRGAFNRLVWHASGPVALGRDAVLRMRRPSGLLGDFDWLYGWRSE